MKNATRADLEQSIPHLAFEFYHFQLYGRLIEAQAGGHSPVSQRGLRQAVGYTFLVHLRALLDFFYRTTGKDDDDLLAADFSILPGFSMPVSSLPKWLGEVKGHLNKRLAHITSPRWKGHSPNMHYYHQHFPEITALIRSFEDSLPPDLRNELRMNIDKFASSDAALW